MSIVFQKITNSTDIPLNIKELYHTAFPADERREWTDISRRVDEADPQFSFYVIKHKADIVGFITLWNLPTALYAEHLAILPEKRGGGIGAEVVGVLCDMTRADGAEVKPLVLEVELPGSTPEAERRIGFYERCGLKSQKEFKYIQPPYSPELSSLPLMLMTYGEVADCDPIAADLHTIIYNQPEYRKA